MWCEDMEAKGAAIYANEIDSHAAHWLSCLPIQVDKIDERSILEVKGTDLEKYTQCHFFAGIGGWPLAFEMAGWPIDVPVWSGSCPCQPFSAAGKRKGTADERHLWPEWFRLIRECRPEFIFGEQVESAIGHGWLDIVFGDLEREGYACGAAVLGAHSVGAPHIRQRLFWVAHTKATERRSSGTDINRRGRSEVGRSSRGLADARGIEGEPRHDAAMQRGWQVEAEQVGLGRGMGDTTSERCRETRQSEMDTRPTDMFAHSGWSDCEFIPCRDGKARPVKPGIRCLAHGIPGRVAQLRGLGNVIVPQVAAEFISAFMETRQ